MEKTVYTALIEDDAGIHLLHKAVPDEDPAAYEDFEIAMEHKAAELDGELHCIYCQDDVVEDVTISD